MNATAPAESAARGDVWCTPDVVLDHVRMVAPIALDPCSQPHNPTGASIFAVAPGAWPEDEPLPWSARIDGFSFRWTTNSPDGLVFVNYPYSDPAPWLARCREEGEAGAEVICLGQVDTSTRWWHDNCLPPSARRRFGAPCCAHADSAEAHATVDGRCRSAGCLCSGWTEHTTKPGADATCFWEGRISFVGAPGPARFASFLGYWGPRPHVFAEVFSRVGVVWL